jgi:hypothetical protein
MKEYICEKTQTNLPCVFSTNNDESLRGFASDVAEVVQKVVLTDLWDCVRSGARKKTLKLIQRTFYWCIVPIWQTK